MPQRPPQRPSTSRPTRISTTSQRLEHPWHSKEPLFQVHIRKRLGDAIRVAQKRYTEHTTAVVPGRSSQGGQNRLAASLELCPAPAGLYCGQCLGSQPGGSSCLALTGTESEGFLFDLVHEGETGQQGTGGLDQFQRRRVGQLRGQHAGCQQPCLAG